MAGQANFRRGIILSNYKNDVNSLLKVDTGGLVQITNIEDDGSNITIGSPIILQGTGPIESFVTEISAGLDTNVPTEKAVKDYVDALISGSNKVEVGPGTFSVDSIEISAGGVVWEVVLESPTGYYRMERVMAVTDGSSVQYNNFATLDIGDTSDIVLSAVYVSETLNLSVANSGSETWNVYYKTGINGDPVLVGGMGNPGGSLDSSDSVREIHLTYQDVGSNTIETELPINSHISHIIIKVTTAFNGSTNSLTIGDSGDTDRLLASDVVDLTSVDEIYNFKHHKYVSATQLLANIVATGATQGEVDIIVFYGKSLA